MKSIPAALQAHLNTRNTTLAMCWKVTRKDGKVFGFTEHDEDLVIDGVTYKAATGFTPSAIEASASLAVDNLDCTGLLDGKDIKDDDLLDGLWDNAEIEMFLVNWEDPSQGKVLLPGWGWIGEVRLNRGRFVAEVRGMAQAVQQSIVELFSPLCRADLGDARCKVKLWPPQWKPSTAYTAAKDFDAGVGDVVRPGSITGSGTFRFYRCVQSGTSGAAEPPWNASIGALTYDGTVVWETVRALTVYGHVVTVYSASKIGASLESGDEPAGFFDAGLLTWVTGGNAGLALEVKSHTVSGAEHVVELVEPFPRGIALGDALTLRAGCGKTLADCRDKFNNTYNRRAEDYVPGSKYLMSFGGQ